MDKNWRYGLQLESTGLVKQLFNHIHGNKLNTTRAKQIVSAYLQGKEYFANAINSDVSVRPLLFFYSISSLSRSLTLLLTKSGGEETLAGSHGLSTNDWGSILIPDTESALKSIGGLRVTSCNGLFFDLLKATNNISYLHVRSSAIDWSVPYDIPESPIKVSLTDLLKRLPDIKDEYALWTGESSSSILINSIQYTDGNFEIIIGKTDNLDDVISYANGCINKKEEGEQVILTGEGKDLPLFQNSFLNPTFGSIPNLHMTKPLDNSMNIGQIPMTFILSYYLGMLCRYFPTHWMALTRGNIGDEAWPMIQVCLKHIEIAFPQMIFECIKERTNK